MRNELEVNIWGVIISQIKTEVSVSFEDCLFSFFDSHFKQAVEGDIEIDTHFISVCANLDHIGLLERYHSIAFEVIFLAIEHKIKSECQGVFDQECLAYIEDWVNIKCIPWIKLVFDQKDKTHQTYEEIFTNDQMISYRDSTNLKQSFRELSVIECRLKYFAYETLAKQRIGELFDILIEYPDSSAALADLKRSLDVTRLHRLVIDTLNTSFRARLLHPGANTTDILATYLSTLKALHVLDTSGTLREHACKEVEEYLKTRVDSVRCIISSLTDEENEHGLFEELENLNSNDDENEDDDISWQPKPIRSTLLMNSQETYKPVNVLSTLVNVFNGSEVFIDEYAILLAEKLLSKSDFQVDKEIRTVELLKVQFGESKLNQCEIMLKDIADSKRIHTYINKNDDMFSCTIISHLFWPNQFRKDDISFPKQMEDIIEKFTKEYAKLKASRKLEWYHSAGIVELELEFKNGDTKKDFSVSPLQASLITLFEKQDIWDIESLTDKLGTTPESTKRILKFWISLGVLTENDQLYSIVENYTGEEVNLIAEEDEAVELANDQDDQELEKFVVAMLKNLGSLPLQRIHQMMANVNSNYEKTPIQMQDFLQKLVATGILEFSGTDFSVK